MQYFLEVTIIDTLSIAITCSIQIYRI